MNLIPGCPCLRLRCFLSLSPSFTGSSSHRSLLGGSWSYAILLSSIYALDLLILTWNTLHPGFCMTLTTLCKSTDSLPNPKVYSMYLLFLFLKYPFLLIWNNLICLLLACLFVGFLSSFKFHSRGNESSFVLPLYS